jgi:hypothetical protein
MSHDIVMVKRSGGKDTYCQDSISSWPRWGLHALKRHGCPFPDNTTLLPCTCLFAIGQHLLKVAAKIVNTKQLCAGEHRA